MKLIFLSEHSVA